MNFEHLRVMVDVWSSFFSLLQVIHISKFMSYVWVTKYESIYLSWCTLILFSYTLFLFLSLWYSFSCLIIEKWLTNNNDTNMVGSPNMLQCVVRELNWCELLENHLMLLRDTLPTFTYLWLIINHLLLSFILHANDSYSAVGPDAATPDNFLETQKHSTTSSICIKIW